jgi:hypothetical protein
MSSGLDFTERREIVSGEIDLILGLIKGSNGRVYRE